MRSPSSCIASPTTIPQLLLFTLCMLGWLADRLGAGRSKVDRPAGGQVVGNTEPAGGQTEAVGCRRAAAQEAGREQQ